MRKLRLDFPGPQLPLAQSKEEQTWVRAGKILTGLGRAGLGLGGQGLHIRLTAEQAWWRGSSASFPGGGWEPGSVSRALGELGGPV